MKHNDTAIQLLVDRLYEKALRSSTPKKTAGDMYQAAEIIQQLMAERDEARKQAASPRYLIIMEYGNYDEHDKFPVMFVPDSTTADLIIQDLRENPNSHYRKIVEEKYKGEIPDGWWKYAGYSWTQLPYHTINSPEVTE